MRGKIGIVIGFAAGYVLGSRAGRERYDQIKERFLQLWNTEPVQNQVEKVTEFGKTAAMALPSAIWDGALKVGKSVTGSGTPGKKLDVAIKAGKESADDVAKGAEVTAEEVKKAAEKVVDDVKKAAND